MSVDDTHAAASEALPLAEYPTDIATAALELASAPPEPHADDVAIAQALIRTATAIQALANTLIDRHHGHGDTHDRQVAGPLRIHPHTLRP